MGQVNGSSEQTGKLFEENADLALCGNANMWQRFRQVYLPNALYRLRKAKLPLPPAFRHAASDKPCDLLVTCL